MRLKAASSVSALPVIGSATDVTVDVESPLTIAATSLDPTCNLITLQFDISNHLAGNTAAMLASCDFSPDGGNTWTIGYAAIGRNQGYNLVTNKSGAGTLARVTFGCPSGETNMIRATLTSTGPVSTYLQILPAVSSVAAVT